MGGKLTFPGGGFYHATKYAVEAISDALRFEVKGFGIDVIVIEPGLIKTALRHDGVERRRRRRGADDGPTTRSSTPHVARATESVYEKGSPVGRLGGPPEAVAKVIEKAITAKRPRARYTVTPSRQAADHPARAAARPRLGRRHALTVPPAGPMSDVERLAERAQREGRFGIDTEFMPEGRYRPLLCLVQLCVGGEIVVLDPLEGFDPAPLAAVLADPAVQVVLHAGRQDVAILRREWRTDVTNVFDTQVAAGFAGFAAQAGYTGAAPRRAEDPRRQDRELHALGRAAADAGAALLRARGRRAPAAAGRRDPEAPALGAGASSGRARSAARSPTSSDERDPDEVWRRLPRAGRDGPARARGRARAGAPGASAPRCARTARSARSCATRRWSSSPSASRPGAASWARSAGSTRTSCAAAAPTCSRRSSAVAPPRRSGSRSPSGLQTESVDGPATALSEALVRARAQEAGLAYELIAARADLTPIVVAARRGDPEPAVRTLKGWRRELVGAELLELLRGHRRLGVGDGGRVEIA